MIVTVDRSEMGQGVNTSLAMLVAEELDVPLEGVQTQFAPVDHVYDNPVIHLQITVGSMSVRNAWLRLRSAGADARLRLIAAAAARWNVSPAECRTEAGAVVHDASHNRAGYGELAAAAVALSPVAAPPLRSFDELQILGKPARTARDSRPYRGTQCIRHGHRAAGNAGRDDADAARNRREAADR